VILSSFESFSTALACDFLSLMRLSLSLLMSPVGYFLFCLSLLFCLVSPPYDTDPWRPWPGAWPKTPVMSLEMESRNN
jgi:hypothetical protein